MPSKLTKKAEYIFLLLVVTGSTPFSRTVIKRLKTPDHALPIAFAFVDCESAQCS